MIRLLHINPENDDTQQLDLSHIQGDVTVDSVKSLLEGIIASKQHDYDGIIFNETAAHTNGLDILNTLRQNEVTAPVLFNNISEERIQIYERGNRRRYDLETESSSETIHSFLESIRLHDSRRPTELSFSQLHDIVDSAAVPMLVLNQYASIIYANQMACDYLRFKSPDELHNNSLNRIFPLKSALSGRKDIPALISERSPKEQSFFWEISDRNGENKCVSVRALRLNDSGPVTTLIQLLISGEKQEEAVAGEDEAIVGIFCNSKIIRTGLEEALGGTTFFTEFIESEGNGISGEDFVGTSMAIYACSHFNDEELERMQSLKSEAGGRPFLVVALASEETAVEKALESGVRGIVIGEDEFDTVTNALQVLNMGGHWIPDGQKIRTSGKSTRAKAEKQNSEILNKLTRRETQVLSMLAKGMKNHDIADSLELSYRTVVTHVYNIYRKLNLSSRTEAIHLAIASGLVDVNS